MNTVTLRKLHIGHGMPKVIVPIAEISREGILAMGKKLRPLNADAVEWRADFYDGLRDTDGVLSLLRELRSVLGDMPLIFTCRTAKEGGMADISDTEYAMLNTKALHSGYADAIDIEALSHGEHSNLLIRETRELGCVSIGSFHIMHMPPYAELVDTLDAIHRTGTDITKLAAMAASTEDALVLMGAARQAKARGVSPLIAIAMGEQGVISRILAELSGSDAVFAAASKASAPGQLSLGAMREILKAVHENIR
ncbi:MAG: type I 3-dehydroquinate dehydratase [Clostridia bacterium]|nr:type I 3-dehydroquinate dehydratase [Clostridia bacterium]